MYGNINSTSNMNVEYDYTRDEHLQQSCNHDHRELSAVHRADKIPGISGAVCATASSPIQGLSRSSLTGQISQDGSVSHDPMSIDYNNSTVMTAVGANNINSSEIINNNSTQRLRRDSGDRVRGEHHNNDVDMSDSPIVHDGRISSGLTSDQGGPPTMGSSSGNSSERDSSQQQQHGSQKKVSSMGHINTAVTSNQGPSRSSNNITTGHPSVQNVTSQHVTAPVPDFLPAYIRARPPGSVLAYLHSRLADALQLLRTEPAIANSLLSGSGDNCTNSNFFSVYGEAGNLDGHGAYGNSKVGSGYWH